MNNDFLVCIITYKRPEFFSQCLDSVLKVTKKENIVVINDGSPYPNEIYRDCTVITNKENLGVAKTKNVAMTYFLSSSKEHLFLLEDDIIIKRSDVFDKYIQASNNTGILHFNYGPGSPFNRKQNPNIPIDLHTRHLLDQNSEPNPRLIVDYKNDKIALYQHTVAMFSYFNKKVITTVGLMDERFSQYLSWEHVEHTYRIHIAGFTTPFWWFADIENSQNYLSEAPGAIDKSSIAEKKDDWMKKVMKGRELYKSIHNFYPNHTPDTSELEVINFLMKLKKKI